MVAQFHIQSDVKVKEEALHALFLHHGSTVWWNILHKEGCVPGGVTF